MKIKQLQGKETVKEGFDIIQENLEVLKKQVESNTARLNTVVDDNSLQLKVKELEDKIDRIIQLMAKR